MDNMNNDNFIYIYISTVLIVDYMLLRACDINKYNCLIVLLAHSFYIQ